MRPAILGAHLLLFVATWVQPSHDVKPVAHRGCDAVGRGWPHPLPQRRPFRLVAAGSFARQDALGARA